MRRFAYLLYQEGHGSHLVDQPQLSVGRTFGVSGISEDSSVQEGSMHVSHHTTDVSEDQKVESQLLRFLATVEGFVYVHPYIHTYKVIKAVFIYSLQCRAG